MPHDSVSTSNARNVPPQSAPDDQTASITFRPIGVVENEIDEGKISEDTVSRIVLEPHFMEGLRGVEPGQRMKVVFFFHKSHGYDLCQHPRGDPTRPRRGVFALCSPRRPNPIGVTVVEVIGIDDHVIRVRGLDAWNGTPVLDLKPA